ncbi:cache domain-containing protein [Clostridium sporogenes]|uniref:Chemotaxis protein n=2 Tax=Clostridium sporogenes TaxID=1509 RepID=A0A7X5P722_CLOSG|nr:MULTISPECIES: cache domain-containing protein [Clostridium]AJD32334.1 methyl-accepting chemotaxis (MCP) signaling domain protein [Clostridium botulinum Prevot_594]AVP61521.1 chemotaxis protein [Clostridium botulinum]AKC62483.1 methyl-accepting chemotaxis protein [Clostridium sporogenes]AKJ89747.1 chemotaxis protein [Clostridium sporogenes]KCZ68379.1 methyl-accepting chemotaxis protein 4 [Clostridium sporogenes]
MKKISTKIAIMAILISTITAFCIGGFSIYQLFSTKDKVLENQRKIMLQSYDLGIQNEVESAISVLEGVNKRYEKGQLKLEEAKKLGAELLRNMKYGKEGYFWADTLEGINVVLLGKNTEGKSRLEMQDAKGKYLIKEIIENGKKEEGGFTDYYFPKNGGSEPLPKRSYSKLFKPFNWVIGTGNYIDTIDKIILTEQKSLEKQIFNKIVFLLIMMVVMLSLAIIAGITLGKKISSPILHITRLVEKTANFDLVDDQSFDNILKFKDETGIIGQAVVDLRKQLRHIFESVKDNSNLLLSNSEILSHSSETTADSIEAVGKTLEELAKGSVDQAKNSQVIVESLSGFSEELNGVVDTANKVKDFSKETEKENIKGRDSIYILNEKFVENKNALSMVGENVNELWTKSNSIGEIVGKIQNIAEQTNLLALNAAIEAARAGEAGKGFAVVAEEVRKLSEQVEESTREISQEIQEIQKKINDSKNSMNESENIILEVNNAVEDTKKVFNTIEHSTKNTIDQITNLYDNITRVSKDKDNILESIHSISAISEESAAGLEEVSASTQEQTKIADSTMEAAETLKEVVLNLNEIISKVQI